MGYKLFCLLALLTLPSPPATAEDMTQKDVAVIARTVGLLENGPKGEVTLAVIKGSASQSEAESFVTLINNTKAVTGKTTLKAVYVAPADIAASGAEALLVLDGVDESGMEAVFQAAQERQLAIFTTSETCLSLQKCAIYFKTSPAVDIRMSQSAAKQTGVRFGSALRMMIKEVP